MISTPGDVGQLDYDASGKLARSKAAIDRVVHEDFCCCKKNCTRVWKLAFGWKPNAWDDENSMARSTIETNRSACAGVDYTQRMLHFEARLKANRERVTEEPVRGGAPIQTGESLNALWRERK